MNLKTIRDMMVQANESNIGLHRHMTTIIDHIKVLQSPLEQLEKSLPTITELDGAKVTCWSDSNFSWLSLDEANKPKLARLALLNEKVETMKKQREMLLSDFRKKIHDDDITKLVLMQRQDNHKVSVSLLLSGWSTRAFVRPYFLIKSKNTKNWSTSSSKIVLHKITFYNRWQTRTPILLTCEQKLEQRLKGRCSSRAEIHERWSFSPPIVVTG